MQILLYILIAFIGYLIGRFSHYHLNTLFNNPNFFHHWIYGLILIILGLIFYKNFFGFPIFSFGLGYFISDFKDFLHLEFYGLSEADKNPKKKFWDFD